MQKLALWLISIYQKIPGPWHDCCRFYPSCSNYAKEAITNYGFIKGGLLAIKRIFRCNPFGGCGYDPVPKLEYKKKNL